MFKKVSNECIVIQSLSGPIIDPVQSFCFTLNQITGLRVKDEMVSGHVTGSLGFTLS